MENKKQLILIPPLSEPLRKLNEVLEGIAVDENIEISVIDDLKELGQFVATTGQCLILCSNAKKCATFLQENKSVIMRNHIKTILFTPKEIPAKTLVKFTKVGLTESILESLPPKTFLYKVKLLLRSIKTAKNEDEKEAAVKSLGDGSTQKNESDETTHELKSAKNSSEEEGGLDYLKNKKERSENEESVDYGASLKGKIKPQDESIDTHWKSKREKNSGENSEAEDSSDSALDKNVNKDIDMYYRGKKSKEVVNIELDPEEKKKALLEYEEIEKKAKRNNTESSLESVEDFLKQKRLKKQALEEESQREREKFIDLTLEEGAKKNASKANQDDESENDLIEKKSNQTDLQLDPAAKNDLNSSEHNDLGGHYKGKIKNTEIQFEDSEETQKEVNYDNSDLIETKKKGTELNLEEAEKKNKKTNQEEGPSFNSHDSEVDKINNDDMTGEGAAADRIKTTMGGKTDPTQDDLQNLLDDLIAKKKKHNENKNDDSDKKKNNTSLESSSEDDSQLADPEVNIPKRDQEEKRDTTELNLEPGTEEARKLDRNEKDDSNLYSKKSTALEKESSENDSIDLNKAVEESAELRNKTASLDLDLEKSSKKNGPGGKVDKIDTFYRSGEATKKEHSWDNLDKSDRKVSLDLVKNQRREDETASKAPKKDLGETSIDYRQLKQEFEMLSRGESVDSSAISSTGTKGAKGRGDEDVRMRVIEIDSRSLDFIVQMQMSIFNKEIKGKALLQMIAEELLSYNGQTTFYGYKLSENSFNEVFSSYNNEFPDEKISLEDKASWNEFKNNRELMTHFQNLSMTTWRSPETIQNGNVWEDVSLPSWAEQELSQKKVELVFPYFDGLDRMGLALVIFPKGLNTKDELSILTTLEMARSVLLDNIQRYQAAAPVEKNLDEAVTEAEPKKILSIFGGLFGKKKAG